MKTEHNHHIKSILSKVKTTNETTILQYLKIQYIYFLINNGIIMENTAPNDTTTTKDQDWKQKKGYGPIIAMSLALLLGLSFYLGGHLGGDTTLYRDKKEMQNVAASSSSTSLMGSGTAASDLKTLTIEIDDDATVDGLLSEWLHPKGGSSIHCKKNTGYNCGAVFPPGGDTCSQKGCCCKEEDGSG